MGSVWRITWAHPEYGQVIATCSFDRTIAIWEEITGQVGKVSLLEMKKYFMIFYLLQQHVLISMAYVPLVLCIGFD